MSGNGAPLPSAGHRMLISKVLQTLVREAHTAESLLGLAWPGEDLEKGPKKKEQPVNAEINGREVDFKNISIQEALDILQVCVQPVLAKSLSMRAGHLSSITPQQCYSQQCCSGNA